MRKNNMDRLRTAAASLNTGSASPQTQVHAGMGGTCIGDIKKLSDPDPEPNSYILEKFSVYLADNIDRLNNYNERLEDVVSRLLGSQPPEQEGSTKCYPIADSSVSRLENNILRFGRYLDRLHSVLNRLENL